MNNVILTVRPTDEPKTTEKDGKIVVARFTGACQRDGKVAEGQQSADFISIKGFDSNGEKGPKNATFIKNYVRKGVKYLIRGKLQTGSYTDADGKKVYTTDVVVDNIEFCEKKDSTTAAAGSTAAPATSGEEFMPIPEAVEDELPFN